MARKRQKPEDESEDARKRRKSEDARKQRKSEDDSEEESQDPTEDESEDESEESQDPTDDEFEDTEEESQDPTDDESEKESEHESEKKQISEVKKKKTSIGSHCEPNVIIESVECLTTEAKDYVRECGFGGMLDIKVKGVHSIETAMVIMGCCNVSSKDESFTIVLSKEKQIKVTPQVVGRIFGLPAGDTLIVD
ncbi:unnamed protein product [Urochloa humidicola]